MQRVHEDDLTGTLIAKGVRNVLTLPAIAMEPERIQIGENEFYERAEGELLHPEREDRETLEKIKQMIGSFIFAAQYQQNPLPPEGNMIQRRWLQRYSGKPPRDYFSRIVHSWDTATEIGEANDYSVCTNWGIRENRNYLLDVLRVRMDFPALKQRVISYARVWGADTILIEKAGSGHALLQSLINETNLPVVAITPKYDKETRLAQVSAQIEAGRVFLPKDAPWLAEFEKEILAFPNGKYDDQVDSMTQFLRWVVYYQPPKLEVRVTTFPRRKSTFYDRMGGSFPL